MQIYINKLPGHGKSEWKKIISSIMFCVVFGPAFFVGFFASISPANIFTKNSTNIFFSRLHCCIWKCNMGVKNINIIISTVQCKYLHLKKKFSCINGSKLLKCFLL